MKKFKIFYVIIIVISIIMIITKGVSGNISIYSYNDADSGIIDGFQGEFFISIVNCVISAIMLIATIIVTFNKNNKIKMKVLLFVVTTILILFIPLGSHLYSGGIAGVTDEKNIYLWSFLTIFL